MSNELKQTHITDFNPILKEMSKGLLCWYPFRKNARILYVGNTEDSILEFLQELELSIDVVEESEYDKEAVSFHRGKETLDNKDVTYDYILIPYAIEHMIEPTRLLVWCYHRLIESGSLLFGMNNRLGLRNFCGDRDPYTNRIFDGIENYTQVATTEQEQLGGREYSKAQIQDFLSTAGWEYCHFFSVLPNLQTPQLIYAEEELPREDLSTRYFPRYHYPDTVFLNEERLYEDVIKNDFFHQTANAYLVECVKNEQIFCKEKQITLSLERSAKDAMATMIYEDKVIKKMIYPDRNEKFECLLKNEDMLRSHGVAMVKGKLENGVYSMPFVDAPVGNKYLKELFFKDTSLFLQTLDQYRDTVMKSSEHVEMPESDLGIILKNGYIDLVPLNSFYINGEFVFYDQEFCVENLPANVLLHRAISNIYSQCPEMNDIIPIKVLWQRYGMEEQLKVYADYASQFLSKLRNLQEQKVYLVHHEKKHEIVNTNRQRMNFSTREYQRLFVNIFDDLENRKLILFGSGNFTKKFLALYGKEYPIHFIVDNEESKWGSSLFEIPIMSPESLKQLPQGSYKVIICIKKYLHVLNQLKEMGINNIGIYDVNMDYPKKEKAISYRRDEDVAPKKYHKGYIAGVFDLFHIGHLNMFKRAKEQCDYLIVGVVPDQAVRENKKTEPFVPFEERIEMVRACKYVDEAVEIPYGYGGTRDAYRMYHFDCQFSGSDYADNPNWLAEKEFLEKNGAELVFFPYTQSTSSTKLKAAINKTLEQ